MRFAKSSSSGWDGVSCTGPAFVAGGACTLPVLYCAFAMPVMSIATATAKSLRIRLASWLSLRARTAGCLPVIPSGSRNHIQFIIDLVDRRETERRRSGDERIERRRFEARFDELVAKRER